MIKEKSIFLEKLQPLVDTTSKVKSDAWKNLLEIGLPGKKSEAYKYTQITNILEKKVDLGLNIEQGFDKWLKKQRYTGSMLPINLAVIHRKRNKE